MYTFPGFYIFTDGVQSERTCYTDPFPPLPVYISIPLSNATEQVVLSERVNSLSTVVFKDVTGHYTVLDIKSLY